MEFSFENNFTVDQQVMTESVRSSRRTFVTLSRIPLAITGLGILSILARTLIQHYLDLPMLLRWTIFFLLFLRISTTPRRTGRRVVKDFKRVYQVESVECTTQFGDKIRYALQGAEDSVYDYDCITRVASAKRSYILCFKKKVLAEVDPKGNERYITKKGTIPVTRDGFTQGDFESFKKFLAEKCPNVKIPE